MIEIFVTLMLMLERPPLPTVLLCEAMGITYEAIQAPKCGEYVSGCLHYPDNHLPDFHCGAAPGGVCINGGCSYYVTCEPSGPKKPKPEPQPMVAEVTR